MKCPAPTPGGRRTSPHPSGGPNPSPKPQEAPHAPPVPFEVLTWRPRHEYRFEDMCRKIAMWILTNAEGRLEISFETPERAERAIQRVSEILRHPPANLFPEGFPW